MGIFDKIFGKKRKKEIAQATPNFDDFEEGFEKYLLDEFTKNNHNYLDTHINVLLKGLDYTMGDLLNDEENRTNSIFFFWGVCDYVLETFNDSDTKFAVFKALSKSDSSINEFADCKLKFINEKLISLGYNERNFLDVLIIMSGAPDCDNMVSLKTNKSIEELHQIVFLGANIIKKFIENPQKNNHLLFIFKDLIDGNLPNIPSDIIS